MADVATTNETEVTTNACKAAAVLNGGNKPLETGDVSEPSKPGTSTQSPTKTTDNVKLAMQNLAAGKRSLLVEDYNAAEASLSQACEMFAIQYGETAIECAEPLFLYGKSLLELARVEAGVINNGLDGVPEDDDDDTEAEDSKIEDPEKCTEEEKEEISVKVSQALEENFTELEKIKSDKDKTQVNGEKAKADDADMAKTNGKAEVNGKADTNGKAETNGKSANGKKTDESEEQNSTEEEGEEDEEGGEEDEGIEAEGEGEEGEADEPKAKEDTESIGSNEAGPSAAKDTKDVSAIEAEEEDDPSNLQRAWEMLEMAKLIYTKHIATLEADSPNRHQFENQLSETYQKLGEVSIENEDYKQAIEDLTTCLKLRQKLLPEDSRCIAETHYQLGVAQGFHYDFDEAVKSLNDAIAVLKKRIDNLKAATESKDPAKVDDAFYTREREIAEIEGLLPEIVEKITDTEDLRTETLKKLGDKRADEEALKADASEPPAAVENSEDTSSKSASNISHLVKKRKKSETENGTTENGADSATTPAKKQAVATNGHANANDV